MTDLTPPSAAGHPPLPPRSPRSRWLDLGNAVLRWQLHGTGAPALVLLHEMGGTLESWDDLIDALAWPQPVLSYDQRGCGLSSKLGPAGLTLDDQVRDLHGLLDALSADSPLVLAGCAFGATTALAFAARHPQRVAGIVAMAPALGVPPDRRAAVRARADQIERHGAGVDIDARLAGPYPPALRVDTARFAELRARRVAGDGAAIAAALRVLAELEPAPTLAAVRCPVLVLAGRLDGERPPHTVRASVQALPCARIDEIDSGHFMAWQTPALVADRMRAFMDTLPSPVGHSPTPSRRLM